LLDSRESESTNFITKHIWFNLSNI
jgi:hypothetical protein